MNKYEEYQDSGVEWIGEVPSHWRIVSFKKYFKSNMGATILTPDLKDNGLIPVYSATQDDKFFGYVNHARVILQQGDIVIPARGNSIGYIKLVQGKSTTTQTTIYSKKIKNISSLYVKYYFIGLKKDLFHFVQTAIPQITVKEVNDKPLLIPPIEVQEQITKYLDCKIGVMDELLVNKKKQVELLKEKKQAVINDVVTKGLNPDVEFKETNIDYIGKIPTHWNVTMLKYIGTAKIGAIYSPADVIDNTGTLVLRSSNIQNGKLSLKDTVYIKQKKANTTHNLKTNDILICSRNGSRNLIGKNILINEYHLPNGTIFGAFMTVFRSKYNEFLYYIFNTYIFKYYSAMFLTSTINQLTIANLYSLTVPLPPIAEQTIITNYLDEKTSMIDDVISQIQKSIELLEEYKTSLISHVVTGKIKVINS